MATKLLVCPECSTAVVPGRFACTSCGALLAAVANTSRSVSSTEEVIPPIVTRGHPLNASVEVPAGGSDPAEETDVLAAIRPAWAQRPIQPDPGAEPDVAVDDSDPPTELASAAVPEPAVAAPASFEVEPRAEPEPDLADHHVEPSVPEPAGEPRWPEVRAWPPAGAVVKPDFGPEDDPRPLAGAYLPPSTPATAIAEPTLAAVPVVPAGAVSIGASVAAPSTAAIAGPDVAIPAPATRRSRWLPALDPAVPSWVVAIGAGIAGAGFLLPWAAFVIGGGLNGGYLDQWGLAGPGHPALLLVLVALGVAASQTDRLPVWVRPGLPAVILASLLIGLIWPYLLVRTLLPATGVYVTLVGALVLAAGGLLDLWAPRHAKGSPAV